MATITDDLAKAVTEGFRQAQIDIVNQDLILSGTGDVTITRADGSKKTGPSWAKLSAQAMAAGDSAAAAKASEKNAKTSETNANSSKNAAADSAAASESARAAAAASQAAAKASEDNSKASEKNSAANAASAAASLAAAQLLTSVPYEEAPFPDVWLPLNDDMRLLAGSAPYDRLTISGQVLELPTKSATFTRSTTGTYFDKSGAMKLADINEPRFEKTGLLIESQATNLYINSEIWGVGSNVTVTNNAGVSLRGDNTMALVLDNATNGEHFIDDRNIAVTAGTVYCYSVYVKAHTSPRWLMLRTTSNPAASVYFDPSNGAFSGTTGSGAAYLGRGFEDLGNGIYRVWMTITAVASQVTSFRLQLASSAGSGVFAGDGASGLYVWGAQLEEGSFPTSYIKTSSAPATRSPDYWEIAKDNSGYQNLAVQFNRTVAFELMAKWLPTSSYTEIFYARGVSNDIVCRLSTRINSYRGAAGLLLSIDANVPSIFTHTLSGDTTSTYYQGRSASATSSPLSTNQTPTGIGNGGSASTKYVYYIRNLRIWHRALTPNQIKGLR
ncbi:phage head spike fiber domain-containing protein [Leclercia adecarboxylata]|uniref:phage head spike fiber domain-containing protein n=1 Tax=Leclercia adecarboxylata TaxID=83655 RepID=UPI0030166AA8